MELFKSRPRVVYTNAVGDKVYPVVVDIKKGIKSTEDIQFVSSDVNTGILSVAFIQGNDNYNVTGADVVCSVMRPDASTLELPCEVVGENIVEVPLGINGTSQDGVYSFDFKVLKGGNKVVGTPIMNYSVSLSISNDMVVEEDDRLPVLTMLMTQVTELKDEAREVINQANTATEASREATANAIEATNNANVAINTANQKMLEVDNAKNEMTTTVSNKVNEVETRFNALTSSQQQSSEVIDARDGETSLKARLDRDIEKAKQVYVELEGSYISTESSTGAIQDLEILGNTVQDPNNLADIKSVGELQEDGTYKMSILSCGKNLINPKEFGSMDSYGYCTIDIKVKSSTEYRFTHMDNSTNGSILDVLQLNAKNEIISNYQGMWHGSFLTTSANTIKVRLKTHKDKVNKVKMCEGRELCYEPYQGNKCDILLPCQLEKVGDVSDRLYYDDVEKAWCIEKNVETKEDLTILSWVTSDTSKTETIMFRCSISDRLNGILNLLNNRIDVKNVYSLDEEGVFGSSSTTDIYFRISKTTCSDLDSFKQYLKNNNVLFKYQLATPQKIVLPLDVQIQLNSFFGTTHIYMESGEVEGTIKCKIPKSLGATVQSLNNKTDILSDRIEAIEGLKDSQNMKYETDKGYLVCKETKNGVIDDMKIKGKTLVNLFKYRAGQSLETRIKYDLDLKVKHLFYEKLVTLIPKDSKKVIYDIFSNTTDSWIRSVVLYGIPKTVQLASDEYIGAIYGLYSDGWVASDSNVFAQNCLVLEGDHTQNPPSYFEGLMSVGQDVDKIEVLSRNENLFDNEKDFVSEFETKHTYDGKDLVLEGNWYTKYNLDYIPKNTDFVVCANIKGDDISQAYVKVYYSDGSTLSSSAGIRDKGFAKYNSKNGVSTINLYCSGGTKKTVIYENFGIYLSSEKQEFVNPKQDKKQILFYNENGELEPIQELHEWDSIEKHSDNKWYYHKRSGKVVLNGSENWNSLTLTASGLEEYAGFGTPIENGKVTLTGSNYVIDTHGFASQELDTINNNGYLSEALTIHVNGNLYIRILKSKLSTQDVQGFKQWLQTNNVTVVYQLAQEEIYELAPLHLDSYANETLILCNSGAISPKMEFSITSHINELIKSQGDRISLLEEKVYKALKQVLAGDMYSLAELLYPEDFVEETPENGIMLLPFE